MIEFISLTKIKNPEFQAHVKCSGKNCCAKDAEAHGVTDRQQQYDRPPSYSVIDLNQRVTASLTFVLTPKQAYCFDDLISIKPQLQF